MNKIKNVMIWI